MTASDTHTRRQVGGALLGVATGALVVLVMVLLVRVADLTAQIRETQKVTAPLTEKIDKTSRRIRSCTTPKMPCYERSQRQTAKAVGDINEVVILAAACASQMPGASVADITRCVTDGLDD